MEKVHKVSQSLHKVSQSSKKDFTEYTQSHKEFKKLCETLWLTL